MLRPMPAPSSLHGKGAYVVFCACWIECQAQHIHHHATTWPCVHRLVCEGTLLAKHVKLLLIL